MQQPQIITKSTSKLPAKFASGHGSSDTAFQFESATRQLRWLCIIAVALCFPYTSAYEPYIFYLIAFGVIYNLSRYSKKLLSYSAYASPWTIIILDTIFVGTLVGLVGDINSPYSAFLVFMIVTATYRYRLVGGITVAIAEALWLYIVAATHWFPPNEPTGFAALAIITMAFVGIGILVDRLTYVDQEERFTLKAFNAKTDTERSHLLALANTLTSAVFVVNNQSKIVLYNDAAQSLTGNKPKLRGEYFKNILALHERSDTDAKKVDLLATNVSPQHRRDLCFSDSGGQTVDLDITVHEVQLENAKTTDFIIVCEDITRERSLDEQRSEFISVASHELRTPIAIMEAALSTALLSSELPDETRALLEQAHGNSALLAGIIKDLSTLAQAKNDNIPIQIDKLDAQKLLMQVTKDFKPQADQKKLALVLDIASQTPTVLTTERHVREILQNYLTNAIKYTPNGEIHASVKPARNGGVLFSITDNGIGISAADQKHLFMKFFRVEDYRTRSTGGTGLGLYLCRELAERIGGRVWCESTLNRGSTFFLEIPPFSGQTRDQGEVVKAQVADLIEGL